MQLVVPSERNFEIFHAVETHGLSRREAALKFDISPTRVQQVVEQVRYYVAQFGSEELRFAPPQFAELGSLRLCYERMRHVYGQLMRAWHESQQLPVPSTTASKAELPSDPAMNMKTLATAGGNLKPLQQAMKIAVEQTKIAARMSQVYGRLLATGKLAPAPTIDEVVEAADDEDVVFATHTASATAADTAPPPPKGSCTVTTEMASEYDQDRLANLKANAAAEMSCDDTLLAMQRHREEKQQRKHPAQRA
ncbi:MAG TPA: hypothetical protein VL096_16085 [Pirellulaceae bacterium]|nr:hypothetical protein [Pirellulaceae bacterium]